MRSRVLALVIVAGGCADVPQPYDLDHARVMAVRIEPPAIPAAATARLDVLVTDSSARPRVADPAAVVVTLPAALARPELASFVARGDRGWEITAPAEPALAAIRAALGLAPGVPVIVPLELAIDTLDGTLAASKTIALGRLAANPPAPTITVDGVAGELALRAGIESTLAVANPDDAYAYRWFSSVGDLVGFTRPAARIDPAATTTGDVVVVVRDQDGGTAWSIAPASVHAP